MASQQISRTNAEKRQIHTHCHICTFRSAWETKKIRGGKGKKEIRRKRQCVRKYKRYSYQQNKGGNKKKEGKGYKEIKGMVVKERNI